MTTFELEDIDRKLRSVQHFLKNFPLGNQQLDELIWIDIPRLIGEARQGVNGR